MNHLTTRTVVRRVTLTIIAMSATTAYSAQTERAFTQATRYNLRGQITGVIAPDPDGGANLKYLATRNTYDSRGLLTKVETGELSAWQGEEVQPKDWGLNATFSVITTKEFTYDDYGFKSTGKLRGTNGNVEALVQYSYNAQNLVKCRTVRMNSAAYGSPPADACALGAEGSFGPDRVTRYTYDGFDQPLTEERAVGTPLQQTYVTNGYSGRLLTSMTDANGNRTELRYNDYGLLARRVYPSAVSPGAVNENDYIEYTYEKNGNMKTDRKRNGAVITYTYDGNNRPIIKDLSDNTNSPDVYFNYDLRGIMLSARFDSDAGEGETNTPNGFGEIERRDNNFGGASLGVSYRYDDDSNRTRVTHPDGYFMEYGFDGLDRPISLAESNTPTPSSAVTSLLTWTYGSDGKRAQIARLGGATTAWFRDNAQRLDSFTQNFSGTANDLTNVFSYNSASQLVQLTQTNTAYNYRESNNKTGIYAPNGLNQYQTIDSRNIGYDTNGNLTNDGDVSYVYDMENHLVSAAGTVNGVSVNATFAWDPNGHLAKVTVNGATTRFIYDGDALIAEYSGTNVTRRYAHGNEADEPLVQYNGATLATRRFLFADHLGSIIAQSDSSGAVTAAMAYDPYGIPAASNIDRFGYTGQMWIRELGINHYKARMYAPKLGRFLQTDPTFYKDDMNMYAYVGNDPMMKNDPSGLKCEDTGSAVDCKVDNIVDKQGNATPLTDAMRTEMKEAGKGFFGGLAKAFGVGKAGLGARIERVERQMSTAMTAAKTAGDSPVTIKGNGSNVPDTPTSGTDIVNAVVGKTVLNVGNFSKPGADGIVFAATNKDTNSSSITWYSPGLSESNGAQMITFLHEGMHVATNAWSPSIEPKQENHRGPLNDAAREILEMGL